MIDLTGDLSTVHPHSLAVATATARAVEASLAARAAGARRAPARPLRRPRRARPHRALSRRPGRTIGAVPPGWKRPGPARDPARRRRADAPVRRARGGRAGLPHARGVRRARGRVQARHEHRRARWSSCLPRPRPRAARRSTARHDRAAPAAGRDPRAAVRAPGRDERRARCAPTCTATAAASRQRARRGLAGCASSSARGSTPTATASRATSRPTSAGSKACSPPAHVREAAEAYPGPLLPSSRGARRRPRARAPRRTGCARP